MKDKLTEALLLFTIGPVKTLINQSRKTRDLYAGSYLLSHLTSKVISQLEKIHQVEIILPNRPENLRGNNIPNRIVARLSGWSEEEQRALGAELSLYVRSEFKNICRQVFDSLHLVPNRWIDGQLERFLEVYWVFEPYTDYKTGYAKLMDHMQSIKHLRLFSQVDEPSGKKCSLYLDCNIVFAKMTDGKFSAYIQEAVDVSDLPECRYAIKPSEGLSAAAFIKRMMEASSIHEYRTNVSSVAHMLLKSRLGPEYGDELDSLKYEASEAVLDLINCQSLREEEYSWENIVAAQTLYAAIKEAVQVSPYYALVKLDGDNMGDLYRKCAGANEQKELSGSTCAFAGEVREIIERYGGICIYAGGEDFLGFLPLDTLFPAIMDLHRQFPLKVKVPGGCGERTTFSAGIVIAHLMQPLNEILEKAEMLEKKAKEASAEKNAFALEIIKRGGESVSIVHSFGKDCEHFRILADVFQALYGKQYSQSALYNLTRTLERLGCSKSDEIGKMVKVLIRQALGRTDSCGGEGTSADAPTDKLYALYKAFEENVDNFLSALYTVSFFEKEARPCFIESTP